MFSIRLLVPLLLAGTLAAQQSGYEAAIERLASRDPKTRREAARQLGDAGERRAIPALGKAVKDLDEETRFRAVEALGKMLDREAIPFLSEALGDSSRRVKETAIHGLVTLYVNLPGSGRLAGLFNRTVELFRHSSEELIVSPGTKVDPKVVEALAGAVSDPDKDTARDAARALGILRGRQAVEAMTKVLFEAPHDVAMELLRAFQKIGDPRPAPEVARLLDRYDKDLRGEAAYTLGLLGGRDDWGALRKLFEGDRQREVRRRAFEGLSRMPAPDQAAWFLGYLEDKDERLREFAAGALGRLAPEPGPEIDVKLRARHEAEKDGRVRLALDFALVARGHGEFLGELMDSLDSALHRRYGKAYLVELGRDGSRLTSYYPYLQSPKADIRRYLCDVFGTLANPAALPEVKPLMKDPDNHVVAAAVRAVEIMEKQQ